MARDRRSVMNDWRVGVTLVAAFLAVPHTTLAAKPDKTLSIHSIHFHVPDGADLGSGLTWRDEHHLDAQTAKQLAAGDLLRRLDRLVSAAAHEAGLPDALVGGSGVYELSGTVLAIRIQQWGNLLSAKPIERAASVTVQWRVVVPASETLLVEETVSADSGRAESTVRDQVDLAIQHALGKILRSRAVRTFRSGFPPTGATSPGMSGGSVCSTPPLSLPADLAAARAAVVTIRSGSLRGSGVAISSDGLVVTRLHFDSQVIEIQLPDGKTLPATLRPESDGDLAILEIAETNLACLPISPLDHESAGVDVWAVGSGTVTKGIVGGYREVDAHERLQVDAAINSANDGGPLLLPNGMIAGVSLKSPAGAEPGTDLAIPARAVRAIVGRAANARTSAARSSAPAPAVAAIEETLETLSVGDRMEVELTKGSFLAGVVTELGVTTIQYQADGIAQSIRRSEIKTLRVVPAWVEIPSPPAH